jgi:hypothetical protein
LVLVDDDVTVEEDSADSSDSIDVVNHQPRAHQSICVVGYQRAEKAASCRPPGRALAPQRGELPYMGGSSAQLAEREDDARICPNGRGENE